MGAYLRFFRLTTYEGVHSLLMRSREGSVDLDMAEALRCGGIWSRFEPEDVVEAAPRCGVNSDLLAAVNGCA